MDELWDYFKQHFAELHQEITELHRKVERLMAAQDDINNAKAIEAVVKNGRVIDRKTLSLPVNR